MDEVLPGTLVREAFAVLTFVGGPFISAVLVAGLGVGIAQAATQVNDPAVGFLPRALVGGGVAWTFGPVALERMAEFFASSVVRMGGGGGP